MPKSFLWFLATGGIFLLQLHPVPGIFMMMLAGPFWSVLTVNAGFIGTGWEAATGQVNRAWIALPLLWFGGYEAMVAVSHYRLHSVEREYARHNESQALGFDPARHALVIDSSDDQLNLASKYLVQRAAIPVVYDAQTEPHRTSHVFYRLGNAATCSRLREDPSRASTGIRTLPFYEDGRLADGLCLYQGPQDPSLPVYRVTGTGEEIEDSILPRRIVTIRIEDPSGRVATVKGGRAEPLGLIPLPVIGCALGSSAWQCFATFYRTGGKGIGGSGWKDRGPLPALAEALGLAESPALERREQIGDASTAALDRIAAVHSEASIASLDRMIAGEEGRFTVHDVPGLKDRPDLLAPRAGKMAAAFAAAAPGGYLTRENASVLRDLLAVLRPADFRRVENGLLDLYAKGQVIMAASDRDPLVTRLGNLGPRALPMLERNIGSGPRGNGNVILGLCRVGLAAAGSADKVAAVLRATSRSSDGAIHSAAYVALLRMGRADLADSDPDSANGYHKREYEAMRRSVGPSSPPGVCVDDWGLPRLPDVPARG